MSNIPEFLGAVVNAALAELREDPVPIQTFPLYHDHEAGIVSVCVDTKESCRKLVPESNRWMGFSSIPKLAKADSASIYFLGAQANNHSRPLASIAVNQIGAGFWNPCSSVQSV